MYLPEVQNILGHEKLPLISACLLALGCSPVMAQTSKLAIVVARLYDSGASVQLVITYGPGKTGKLVFKSGGSEARLTEAYQQMIAKLYQQGYTLKSTFSNGNSGIGTLIFVKGQ
jgi:hypothetical protein